jgi:hypothetical protein
MRQNNGASGIENFSIKRIANDWDLMKAKEKGNGAGSNDQ